MPKNIKTSLIIGYGVFCVLFLGCKKDNNTSDDTCMPLPEPNSVFGWQYVYEDIIPSFATFNPNNPNEILYVEINNINAQDLVVFNIQTKEKKILHTGKFLDNRQWGITNWIVFDTMEDPVTGGYAIYKVRPDGSEKEIIVSNNAFSPVINPAGNKILYVQGAGTFVIKNIDGNTIQSCGLGGMGSLYPNTWINDSIVIFSRINQIWSFNVNTCEYHVIVTSPFNEDDFYCMGYLPPDRILWGCMENGIYQTHIESGKTDILKSSCNSKCYYRMSYAPQLDRMLLYRETYSTPDSTNLYVYPKLVLMKPDGTCEKELDLGY